MGANLVYNIDIIDFMAERMAYTMLKLRSLEDSFINECMARSGLEVFLKRSRNIFKLHGNICF